MFGIIWGIASVILLVGLGKGFSRDQKERLNSIGVDLAPFRANDGVRQRLVRDSFTANEFGEHSGFENPHSITNTTHYSKKYYTCNHIIAPTDRFARSSQ